MRPLHETEARVEPLHGRRVRRYRVQPLHHRIIDRASIRELSSPPLGITLALFQVDATVYVVRPGRSNHAVSETSSFLETRLA
jgi:hypothetical protein